MPEEQPRLAILILAAGRGARLGAEVPKAFVDCAGKTLLERSLATLAELEISAHTVLAVHPEDRTRFVEPKLEAMRALGLDAVVNGGVTRQESMANALAAAHPRTELVLIHDAARPFPPIDSINTAIERATACGAALLAIPLADTLKRGAEGRVLETVDRRGLWLAQTPQVVQRKLLEQALENAAARGLHATDDVALLEAIGTEVALVEGSKLNFKVTTPTDLQLACALARSLDADA